LKLFEPINVGRLKLKNRIAMPAIHHSYTSDGFINERLIEYYRVRAHGGAALITIGGCSIDTVGSGPMMIGLHDDKFIPGLARLAGAIKNEGAAAAAQLYQAGRYAFSFTTGQQAIAPSPIASRLTRETPREMTEEDIKQVIVDFGRAARRVKEAGFDAVEVIASAGYLIGQFLSPITNERTDSYGGSRVKRKRFGLEVIAEVRKQIGPDFTLLVRLSGSDFMPGGNSNHDIALFATELEQAGVDCFNVTGGWHESRVPQITGELPRGGFAYLARGIKEAVSVPVMASNRINDPLVAEQILLLNLSDLVNMGRPLIADPDLPKKTASGDFDAIRRCIACNQGCFDSIFALRDVHCTINPRAGRELETEMQTAEEPKNVLIIGGGPAGLEAARLAAERGHRVTLREKGRQLGGNLLNASVPPGKEEFATLIKYYEYQLPRLGVRIFLNHEARAEEIIAEKADVVIMATGSRAVEAPFPVDAPEKVVTALDVLEGKVIPGEKSVVIGGGSVGCETAATIAEMGSISAESLKFLMEHEAETPEKLKEMLNRGTRQVTIVELEKGIGRDIGLTTRWVTMKCIRRLGVTVMDECSVVKIDREGVHLNKGGQVEVIPADTVILAIGAQANNALAAELEGKVNELHLIGDACEPRKLTEAIREGFETGRVL
jgi:2,4-dienoyl-CoA reductase (NADPH2)